MGEQGLGGAQALSCPTHRCHPGPGGGTAGPIHAEPEWRCVEQPCPLPCLGGGDTDEGDRPGRRGAQGMGGSGPHEGPAEGWVREAGGEPGVSSVLQGPLSWEQLWTHRPCGTRRAGGQVGPVLGGASGPGGRHWIPFDSSAQDAQVSGDLPKPVVPPTPSPSALCLGLRLLAASPHRTALIHVLATDRHTSYERLGKGPPGLAPASFLGCKELGGYHAAHTQSPPPRAVCPWCPSHLS